MPEQVDPVLDAAGEGSVDDVDADVFVLPQRIGGGQQEGRAEQIPLQLQPGIRRHVERLPDHSVTGADQDGQQDKPRDPPADYFVESIDPSRQCEQA